VEFVATRKVSRRFEVGVRPQCSGRQQPPRHRSLTRRPVVPFRRSHEPSGGISAGQSNRRGSSAEVQRRELRPARPVAEIQWRL